jgi:hypothetical protein
MSYVGAFVLLTFLGDADYTTRTPIELEVDAFWTFSGLASRFKSFYADGMVRFLYSKIKNLYQRWYEILLVCCHRSRS